MWDDTRGVPLGVGRRMEFFRSVRKSSYSPPGDPLPWSRPVLFPFPGGLSSDHINRGRGGFSSSWVLSLDPEWGLRVGQGSDPSSAPPLPPPSDLDRDPRDQNRYCPRSRWIRREGPWSKRLSVESLRGVGV